MGWHLDGKATLVVGTHTHVQTADERILPNGTAYLTDAGMTGPHDSIIGMEREPALARFRNGMPVEVRAGHRQPAPERHRGGRRRRDRPRHRGDAHQLRRARSGRDWRPRYELPVRSAVRRCQGPRRAGAGADGTVESRRIYTVSELTAELRTTLEERFFEVWVEGELSNCKLWNTGHMYFTMKDAGAQVRGVMFRSALRMTRFTPKDGLRVVARGRLTVYEPKGEYQLVCEHLEPAGLGARQLAFEQLKARLEAEGLFAPARKRSLPELPRKVGVVTSLDGAAVRDIIQVLRRRYANVHIVIRPTRVQGDGAALEIARAISSDRPRAQGGRRHRRPRWRLDRGPVGVQRGSGRARDRGLPRAHGLRRRPRNRRHDCRLRGRFRAATPSAAAEMVLARKDDVYTRVERLARRLDRAVESRADRLEARLRALENRPGLAGFHARLAMRQRHASELQTAVESALRRRVAAGRRRVETLRVRLDAQDVRQRLSAGRRRPMRSARPSTHTWRPSVTARRHDWASAWAGSRPSARSRCWPAATRCAGMTIASAVVRRASQVSRRRPRARRLSEGELQCDVRAARTRFPDGCRHGQHDQGRTHQGLRDRDRGAGADRQAARGRRSAARIFSAAVRTRRAVVPVSATAAWRKRSAASRS